MTINNCTECPSKYNCPFHTLDRVDRIHLCIRLSLAALKNIDAKEFDLPNHEAPDIHLVKIPGRNKKLQIPEEDVIWYERLRLFMNHHKQ